MEHHERFPERVIKTFKQLSIVLRTIHLSYLERRRKRPAHVKYQIFSVAHPPN